MSGLTQERILYTISRLVLNYPQLRDLSEINRGEGGWEFLIWVRKLGDPPLQWE